MALLRYILQAIISTHPIKQYSSVLSSIFIELCNHHHNLMVNIFNTLKMLKLYLSIAISIPSAFHTLAISNLFLVSMTLPVPDISYKSNHTICVLCASLLTQSNIFKVLQFSRIYHCFILRLKNNPLYICISHFINSSQICVLFPLFGYYE